MAMMMYLFYRLYYSSGGEVLDRSLRKTFCCLGVGQVTWIGCGEFQCCRTDQEAHRIILSCVDKLTKENTGFLFKMDWLNVFKDFFKKVRERVAGRGEVGPLLSKEPNSGTQT